MRPVRERISGRQWLLVIAVAVVVVTVGAGCTSSSGSPGGGTSAAGGTLRIGVPDLEASGPVKLISALDHPGYYPNVEWYLIFSGLTRLDPTKDFTPQPDLATSWTISPDQRVYTFHLRPGVTWQDGAPFTSADVKFTLGLIRDPKVQSSAAGDFTDVTEVSAPDPATVVITLKAPLATLLKVMSVGMLPQHLLEPQIAGGKNPRETAFAQHPVGTGPFSFVSYTPGQSLTFKANDRYWAGRPRLNQVILVPGTEEALFARVKAGEIDMTQVAGAKVASLQGDSRLRVVSYPTATFENVKLNTHLPELADPRIRIALNLLVNKQVILNTLDAGHGTTEQGPFDNTAFYVKQDQTFAYDPQQAAQLLTAAGYTRSGSGPWTKDGKPLSLTIHFYNAPQLTELVVNSLKTNGVMASTTQIDLTKLFSDVASQPNNFQAVTDNFGSPADPDSVFIVLDSTASLNTGGYNIFDYSNPTVDAGLIEGRTSSDPGARRSAYAKVQAALAADPPYIWGVAQACNVVVSNAISGYQRDFTERNDLCPGFVYYNISAWTKR
jgi:peptide/nickel transport system substrate-binding protein